MLKVFMPFEYSFISPLCATCSCLSLHHVSVFSRWDPLSSEKAIGLFSTCLSGLLENVCPPAGYQFLLPHNGRLDWLVSNDLFKLTVVLFAQCCSVLNIVVYNNMCLSCYELVLTCLTFVSSRLLSDDLINTSSLATALITPHLWSKYSCIRAVQLRMGDLLGLLCIVWA